MKTLFACTLLIFTIMLFTASTGFAADCGGGWKVIPNYRNSMGAPCGYLGLDPHKGVCQPGQAYVTLCDDTSGGRYKTCTGSTPCGQQAVPVAPVQQPCTSWDYAYNRPCPQGYVNYDCKGGCEPGR